jgi:hypothetical protein
MNRLRAAWHCLTSKQYILAYQKQGNGFVLSSDVDLRFVTKLSEFLKRRADQCKEDKQ